MVNKVIFIAFLIPCILSSFDVKLTRKEYDYIINFSEEADFSKFDALSDICSKEFTTFGHNKYYTTVGCHQQDVSYNLDIMLGDINKQYSTFQMGLDLTTPYSWMKKEDCTLCPTKSDKTIDLKKYNIIKQTNKKLQDKDRKFGIEGCDQSCVFDHVFQSFMYGKLEKEQILNQEMMIINTFRKAIVGHFIKDQGLLQVYDEQKKIEFKKLLEFELKKNYQSNLERIIELSSLKVIYAQSMIGMEEFRADGAIGLGFIDSKSDDGNYIEGSNFIEQISAKYPKHNNVFGLYLGEICNYKQDFMITIGGYSEEYSHNGQINPIYIPLIKSPDRGSLWAVKMSGMKVGIWNQSNKQIINMDSVAIISSTASYIALPKTILQNFKDQINKVFKMDCSIVDNRFYQIYCKSIKATQINSIQLEMSFDGQKNSIKLDAQDLFRRCKDKIEINLKNNDQNDFPCILNVRASYDDNIVLGEPFLKQHYTLFDMENNQIGLLDTIRDSSFRSQFRRSTMQFMIRWATFLFILLLISVCFYKQIRKGYKLIRNKIRERNFKTEITEIQRLNVSSSTNDPIEDNFDEEESIRNQSSMRQYEENVDEESSKLSDDL